MNVITIDENNRAVKRTFEKMSDLKKYLQHRRLYIRPSKPRTFMGNKYNAFTVHSYMKDVTPRFSHILCEF